MIVLIDFLLSVFAGMIFMLLSFLVYIYIEYDGDTYKEKVHKWKNDREE